MRAQHSGKDSYQVRVTTKDGSRFRGPFRDIDSANLYVYDNYWTNRIPLQSIRRVVLRRESKKEVQITGAILGGLGVGYVATETPYRSPVLHGVTVTFAAAGGAVAGLLLSSAISSFVSRRRVIRPLNVANPTIRLYRELEPFSDRYQRDLLDRLPARER
ncbi:hypothetical protein [Spirosoma radiotolerans]|uniref:hypothetical protein n=1 Tax=Spirosoma radiotolerans TaxID=1379870 RepID=UPI000697280A|nr:hypothetical protein [Spirosoma radiotolerans]